MNALNIFYVGLAAVMFAVAGSHEQDKSFDRENAEVLEQAGIGTDTQSLIEFLDRLRPTSELQNEVRRQILKLNASSFAQREAATNALREIGPMGKPILVASKVDCDLETRYRIGRLLKEFDSSDYQFRRRELLFAIVDYLKSNPDPKATESLFHSLAQVSDDQPLQNRFCESIWACSDRSQSTTIQRFLAEENVETKFAAVVALELAIGEQAVKQLAPMLAHPQEMIRLAACRALVDREPLVVAGALIGLVGSLDRSISAQATTLLALATEIEPQYFSQEQQVRYWQSEIEKLAKADFKKLGSRRLDLSFRVGGLVEKFTNDTKDATVGYGLFQFETGIPTKASVKQGVLFLDGNHDEADQRLRIKSEKLTGDVELPDQFMVRVKLGGSTGSNGGFHVGVSIGEAKFLFHPGITEGQFRVEHRDSHEYFLPSQRMEFSPAVDKLHEMTIRVSKTKAGGINGERRFDVQVNDADSKQVFSTSIELKPAQFGQLNQIGLERSGRSGGAALFSEFEFRPSSQ